VILTGGGGVMLIDDFRRRRHVIKFVGTTGMAQGCIPEYPQLIPKLPQSQGWPISISAI